MSYTTAGIRVWDGTESVSIHGASSAMANSINNRIVAYYATAAARNAAYSGVADKSGILVWQDDVQSYLYHDGTVWRYLPQHLVIARLNNFIGQDVATTTPELLIATGNIPLNAGTRKLEITAACVVTGVTGGTGFNPRVFITGSAMGAAAYVGQANLTGIGDITVFSRTWFVETSGTATWQMLALNASGTGYSRFTDAQLTIIDHGASDF